MGSGLNTFTFHAFQPYIHLNLTMKVLATDCEGLFNTSHTFCPLIDMIWMVAHNYNVFCLDSSNTIVLKNDVCIVILRLGNAQPKKATKLTVQSLTGEFVTAVTCVKDFNTA